MEQNSPNPPESAPPKHELRDASPRALLIFAVCFIASLVLVHFVAQEVLNWLLRDQQAQNHTAFPTHPLFAAMQSPPPEPRLQPEPSHDVLPNNDLMRTDAREQSLIGPHSWAWVDPAHRFARIPLEQATNLAVDRGLPTILPTTQPAMPFMPPASSLHGPGGVP